MINDKDQFVYATALSNDEYIPGVMALARSLIQVKSKYKLVVLLPESKKSELTNKLSEYGFFRAVGDYVIIMTKPDIEFPESIKMKDYYWKSTFFKLQLAQLFEYKKVIILDCDQMTVKNIDHLFCKPHMTATTCGRCIHSDWLDLSAGLLVIEPSKEYYNLLISKLPIAIIKKYDKGLYAGDQDVFNETMPDWRYHEELYIPEKYNVCWGMIEALCKTEKISTDDFFMIHFPGKEKPWHRPRLYYIWILVRYLIDGKRDKLFYKVKMYRKYRKLCSPKQ